MFYVDEPTSPTSTDISSLHFDMDSVSVVETVSDFQFERKHSLGTNAKHDQERQIMDNLELAMARTTISALPLSEKGLFLISCYHDGCFYLRTLINIIHKIL